MSLIKRSFFALFALAFPGAAEAQMTVKLSQLPAAAALSGAELFMLDQIQSGSWATTSLTLANLAAYLQTNAAAHSGDCASATGSNALTCTKTNGVAFGSLATLSTINNSNWSGTPLSVANGGTGLASTSANYGFYGPNGSSGAPSMRASVPQDAAAGVAEYDLSRNSSSNNANLALVFSGSSLSASGTAGTTCGAGSLFGIDFPCLQNFAITGDTVNSAAANDLDGWQFIHNFGGSTVQGARQSVDIISTFTAATSASNTNRNYVPLTTYMRINSDDGGTAGTPKGAWFGANHVVAGNVAHGAVAAGQENDLNVFGSLQYRWGFSAVSFGGTEGSLGDAAYEIHAVQGANAANWVNALYLTDLGGLQPISVGGCIICTDGNAHSIYKGIDLHTYTITGAFLWSQGFSVDGPTGAVTTTAYKLANMVMSSTAPTIASGFCTSPSIVANGTAAFKITVGSSCAAGNGALTMPSATNGWACSANDVTNPGSHVIAFAGYGLTSVSFQDYSRTTGAAQVMGSGDTIIVQCSAL